jgi:uncharacterized protein (TIGR03083 family)
VSDRKQSIRDDLVAARKEVLELVSVLTPEQFERPTANEGWSAKDTLAHLSSVDARMRSMWQHALDGQPWPAADADINVYNDRCVAERRSWPPERVIAELEQTGEETLAFFDRLAPEDLDKPFVHPTRGKVTLEELMVIARHLRRHGEEIRAATGM